MRTTVSINEDLLREAKALVHASSQSDLINRALAALLREVRRAELLEWIAHGETKFSMKQLQQMRKV